MRPGALQGNSDRLAGGEEPALLIYWGVLRKHRWVFLAAVLATFTLVAIGTAKQRPVYRAQALLEILSERPEMASLEDLFRSDSVSSPYLESQYKILRSKTLTRRVIEQLNLAGREEFHRRRGLWYKPRSFSDRLSVNLVRGSRLVEVSFESEDPEMAARVVNTLLENYLDQSLEIRWDTSQEAAGWLQEQLQSAQARLEKGAAELRAYAQQSDLVLLESEGRSRNISHERLQQLQEELTRAETAHHQTKVRYESAAAAAKDSSQAPPDTDVARSLGLRMSELRREHTQLLSRFGPEYPAVKQSDAELAEVQSQLAAEHQHALQRDREGYRTALRYEQQLRAALEPEKKRASEAGQQAVQYEILQRELHTSQQLYEALLQRLREAGVSAGLRAKHARVVDAAETPRRPVYPNIPMNLALGTALGLFLGSVVVFSLEGFDRTVNGAEDLEESLHAPLLVTIPHAGRWKAPGAGRQRAERNRRSTDPTHWWRIDRDTGEAPGFAEAFRDLRTSVVLPTAEPAVRCLLVTSPQAAEGKTTVSLNLAISLAQLGWRILLVDADLRLPCLHHAFGLPRDPGLVSHLAFGEDWRRAVNRAAVPGLDLLLGGPGAANPTELLASEAMAGFVRDASAEYRMVIIDSAILMDLADTRTLASLVDGVVLVVRAGKTPRSLARLAAIRARESGARILGTVLNSTSPKTGYGYDYAYRGARKPAPREEDSVVATAVEL
jgi:polysaccharide biosynthesis transport protein